MKYRLDKEEKEISRAFEKGELNSVKNLAAEKRKYASYARYTMRKDKRVNIRVSSDDIQGIQRIAMEEGIPYQTLISSIIHKYVAKHPQD